MTRSEIAAVLVITRREVRDQFRDWRIVFPVVGLTLFFPFLMNFTARQILDFVSSYGATIIGERMVPFLLMVVGFFPISVSLVIALESFVGEKERGSIEPLLNTPLEDWQLYLGKLLSSIVPPLITSYLGMAVYLVGLVFRGITIPNAGILVQIVVLTTVQAVMMVAAAVVVSTQTTSVRAANLLASFIIIPAALLIQGESVVMFWGTNDTLWWVVLGVLLLTVLLVRVGLAHFRREELLGRELDTLRVRWVFNHFASCFVGSARSVRSWYAHTLRTTLNRLALPGLLVTLIVAASFVLGYLQNDRFSITPEDLALGNVNERIQGMLAMWENMPLLSVGTIWWQNVRAMLIALLLGVFSLGILSSIPLIATMGIAGYLMGVVETAGISGPVYGLFLVPHGIVEIPVAIIATAAVLRLGALMATPVMERSVMEVMVTGLAEWTQVMVGVVTPLLLAAAVIEVFLTPRIVLWLLF